MLKEYLTTDGLGTAVSSTEAISQAITVTNPLVGVLIETVYLTPGTYTITATRNSLNGTIVTSPTVVMINGFRINATPPFSPGTMTITLSDVESVFGFDDVASGDASAGVSQYRVTCITNDKLTQNFTRTVADLGTPTVTKDHWLGASGAGTLGGLFSDWPATGWCRISNGEVVYYSSRSDILLTVPTRGRLGTSATVGAAGQGLRAVSGVLIGTGSLSPIANQYTAPAGVTFGQSLTITQLLPSAIGTIWYWREIPAGAVACPNMVVRYNTTYLEYP